jgi:hypothetical protein
MSSSGFELAILASEQPKTHALDRAATVIEQNNDGYNNNYNINNRNYKTVDYVDKKEDPLVLIVSTHQHNINSAL